jgi:uncharacterized protein (DUF2235 family)
MKRIVICCDGTWNSPAQQNQTNVYKLKSAIPDHPTDGIEQRVYYDVGVGAGSILERIPGLFGVGVGKNVRQAYRFIVDNYDPGDQLFFVGFSRGAYTVRSVVGMMRKCGVLRRDNRKALSTAYRFYRDRKITPADPRAAKFRLQNSVLVAGKEHIPHTRFLGVWDTVGALGVPPGLFAKPFQLLLEFVFNRGIRFHDVALSRTVEHACQALAIDESRGDYQPTLWEQHPQAQNQTLEQVWFAGCHTNIGGGAPDPGQSDRTLLWMVEKARTAGLELDLARLPGQGGPADSPLHNSFVHVFKLRSFICRPVGRGVPAETATYFGGRSCESVDPAVLERYKLNPFYHPANLITYFREHLEALGEAGQED